MKKKKKKKKEFWLPIKTPYIKHIFCRMHLIVSMHRLRQLRKKMNFHQNPGPRYKHWQWQSIGCCHKIKTLSWMCCKQTFARSRSREWMVWKTNIFAARITVVLVAAWSQQLLICFLDPNLYMDIIIRKIWKGMNQTKMEGGTERHLPKTDD